MRKWDVYKNMNRNRTMVNHCHNNEERTDTATPNIVMSPVWLQEDRAKVEIIELDSDDSEQNEEDDCDYENIWNYLDKGISQPQPDFYQANKKAREKRRLHNSNCEDLRETYENERSGIPNDVVFTSFYDFTNDLSVKNNSRNHQSNCFTIINKPFHTPDSSCDDIEYTERLNTPDDLNNNGESEDGEIVTFDEDIDTAKRTIWIYSFRNKRVLSENDFELVNIPSRDSASSTSCSLDNFTEERTETKNVCRVSSPMPATFVPRLNLSLAPTLPTVTEITEPTKYVQKTPKSHEDTNSRHKSVNNWLVREVSIKSPKKEIDVQDKSNSTNVINWMCLSPRERRRRFKHTNAGATYQPVLPSLAEVPSSEPISRSPLPENAPNKFQTTAEINIISTYPPEVQTQTLKKSLPFCTTKHTDKLTAVIVESGTEEDELNVLHKPKIILTNNRTDKAKITDPIEKLHSNNWIQEEARKELNKNESVTGESVITEVKTDTTHSLDEECAGKKLWARNMSLLKPVEWAEFLPITDSIPSLHLSIESVAAKRTWMSRLAKCFRCFK